MKANKIKNLQANWRLFQVTRKVAGKARPKPGQLPVVFFNASTRLTGLSLNAAFSFLTACGLQLAGVPVVHFGCKAGMSRCVLGTDRDNHHKPPPCASCTVQAERLFGHAPTYWFTYSEDRTLGEALQGLDLDQLSAFEYPFPADGNPSQPGTIPFGQVVLPSLRWALRVHHLQDDEPTRFLFRQYILSAYRVASEFSLLLEKVEPAAVVVFNGIMYPEATARWVACHHGLRVVTHEVGFQPFSAFFSAGDATAYPVSIPEDFDLSPGQNARLDAYLEKRFQGEFIMAGIRFWPEMKGLDETFTRQAAGFKKIVPVFTNVIYDTSQVHANTVFPHMFAWLDLVLEIIRDHPETLFVIRAHPDEMRPGTRKQSRESVQEWVARNGVKDLPNVVFVASQEYLSSYELIQQSSFVMVYNSSIGLEATLMGAGVLCGGKARYTQYPIVYFPESPQAYRQAAEEFLARPDPIEAPPEFQRNARRFLYYQLYRASLPFGEYLESHPRPGFVQLRPFNWKQLHPEHSPVMQVLAEGILYGKPFLLEEV